MILTTIVFSSTFIRSCFLTNCGLKNYDVCDTKRQEKCSLPQRFEQRFVSNFFCVIYKHKKNMDETISCNQSYFTHTYGLSLLPLMFHNCAYYLTSTCHNISILKQYWLSYGNHSTTTPNFDFPL